MRNWQALRDYAKASVAKTCVAMTLGSLRYRRSRSELYA
jgi:hypothetical protein